MDFRNGNRIIIKQNESSKLVEPYLIILDECNLEDFTIEDINYEQE